MHKSINKDTIKKTLTDWGKVLFLLLDEAAAIIIVIVILHFFEINIPLPVGIILAIILGILIFVIHAAVIPSFHRKQVTGREGMIGTQGRVVKALTPSGTVKVKGERWRAESIDGNIGIDEDVEIVGLDRLTLKVKHKSD